MFAITTRIRKDGAAKSRFNSALKDLGALVSGTSRDFRLVEAAVHSYSGEAAVSEDMIRDGQDWFVLVDGATDKSGLDFGGRTGGSSVAELVCDVVARATTGEPASGLLDQIDSRFWEALGTALVGVDRIDYPSASFVALDKRGGVVVRVGDTSWRTERRLFRGAKKIDQVTSAARAALLRCLHAEGVTLDELRRYDPGRAMILPLLRHQSVLRNDPDPSNDLAFGAIDGTPVPARFVETWHVEPDESTVVLTSDGYPSLELTLDEAERKLAEALVVDPVRLREYVGTKAAPQIEGASFDDRAYARLAR